MAAMWHMPALNHAKIVKIAEISGIIVTIVFQMHAIWYKKDKFCNKV